MNVRKVAYHNKFDLCMINFLHYSMLWAEGTRWQVMSNVVNFGKEIGGLIRGVVENIKLEWVGVKEPGFDGIMSSQCASEGAYAKWILSKAVEE